MNSSPDPVAAHNSSLPELYRELAKTLDDKTSLAQRVRENSAAKYAIVSVVLRSAKRIRAVTSREEAVQLTQAGARDLLQRLGVELDFQSEVSSEILQSKTPKLFIANHQGGGLETFLLPGILEQPFTWVLKDGLMSIPVFGTMLQKSEPIVINRSKPDLRKNGTEIVERLKRGENVLIFFEGTRSQDGSIGSPRLLEILDKIIQKKFPPEFHKIGVMVDTFGVLPVFERNPAGSYRPEAGITVRLFNAEGLKLEDNADNENDPSTLTGAFRVRLTEVLKEKLERHGT